MRCVRDANPSVLPAIRYNSPQILDLSSQSSVSSASLVNVLRIRPLVSGP